MNEVNNIPEGWVETTLGDLIDIFNQQRIPLSAQVRTHRKGIYPYYGASNIFDYIDDYIFDGEYLLISEDGENLNTRNTPIAFIVKGKFWVNNHAHIVKGKSEHLTKYIELYFSKLDISPYITGAVQPKLSKGNLIQIPITLPKDINEQKSIVAILTAFDDKIELLQAQNKTLEELAQTLFKEWFGKYQIGDELPDGWREGKIGDLIEIRRGSSPRPIQDYISDSGYKWLKISDATATDSPYIFEIKEHIITEGLKNTTLKKAGDLVLSNSATPGMPKILAIDTCVHDGWMHFPNSKVSNEYLYLLFLSIRPALVQHGSGSVFTNLKTDILREFEVVISSKDYYDGFDVLVKPIFNKIYNNALQIQTLTKTRDELLPKLMSGEIRVKKQFFENFE